MLFYFRALTFFSSLGWLVILAVTPSTVAAEALEDSRSVTFDFAQRDALPQTSVPLREWQTCCGKWGPRPSLYPPVKVPVKVVSASESTSWLRDRVIAVAKHYEGLRYAHFHIPAMGGLDCSNFTSWVYNYGFGIRFSSHVEGQSKVAGRKLEGDEPLKPGDLLFIYDPGKVRITHVAIFIDKERLIDSTKGSVAVRPFAGWYRKRLAWARRILE